MRESSLDGGLGKKPLDNDAALDWLRESGGVAGIRETLKTVADFGADEYLDVDDGQAAVAAADMVASQTVFQAADRDLARRAMERVLARNSELAGLWDDYEFETEWHGEMRQLLMRLGGDPAAASLAARGIQEKTDEPLTEEKRKLWEESLLTMLVRARGFQLTEAQLARIRASRNGVEFSRWYQRAEDAASVDEVLDGPAIARK